MTRLSLYLCSATLAVGLTVLCAANASAHTVVCFVRADNPHNSSHVKGTINTVGSTSCNYPVASMIATVTLYRLDLRVGLVKVAYGINSGSQRSFVNANAAGKCVPGYYVSKATGWAGEPNHVTIWADGGTKWSTWQYIRC